MYRNGHGVTQDYKTAIKWYRLSAEQGNASAQLNLGAMYANGYGTIQD
jgi:TPR repeat protein